MGASGFPIDLVLFGMIAAFLVLRLRSILGKRTGFERPAPPVQQAPLRPARPDHRRQGGTGGAGSRSDRARCGLADRPGPGADAGDRPDISTRRGSWPGQSRRSA